MSLIQELKEFMKVKTGREFHVVALPCADGFQVVAMPYECSHQTNPDGFCVSCGDEIHSCAKGVV